MDTEKETVIKAKKLSAKVKGYIETAKTVGVFSTVVFGLSTFVQKTANEVAQAKIDSFREESKSVSEVIMKQVDERLDKTDEKLEAINLTLTEIKGAMPK